MTLESSNKSNPAVFSHIEIEASNYLRIDTVKVVAESREGVGVFASSNVQILNAWIHGKNQFNRQAPVYTQVSTLYGINVGDGSSNVVIEGNSVSDVQSSAYVFFGVSEIKVDANRCDWVASDCFKFGGLDQATVTNNFGAQHIYASPSAHVDFMQGQGQVSNSVFRGNVALMGNRSFQGLFFDDAEFDNLLFEDNLIYTAHNRGISVSSGRGIIARYNTVLRLAGSQKATFSALPSGVSKSLTSKRTTLFQMMSVFLAPTSWHSGTSRKRRPITLVIIKTRRMVPSHRFLISRLLLVLLPTAKLAVSYTHLTLPTNDQV